MPYPHNRTAPVCRRSSKVLEIKSVNFLQDPWQQENALCDNKERKMVNFNLGKK